MYAQEYPREPEWAGGLTAGEVRDLQDDGVVSITEPGEGEPSQRHVGYGRPGYPSEGYGRGSYGQEGYSSEQFGRPGYGGYGREGYGREGYGREGYGREGYGREGYGREGYGREGYGGAYSSAATYVQPPVEYVEPESSDLGMGVRDSHVVASTDYGAGYGRPEVGGIEYGDGETLRLREELEHERRRKHEAEVAAVAGVGFGLYERHERNNEGEEHGYRPERHHLFGRD